MTKVNIFQDKSLYENPPFGGRPKPKPKRGIRGRYATDFLQSSIDNFQRKYRFNVVKNGMVVEFAEIEFLEFVVRYG
jgi:hypothetical protein